MDLPSGVYIDELKESAIFFIVFVNGRIFPWLSMWTLRCLSVLTLSIPVCWIRFSMSALLQLMASISHFFRVSFSPGTFQGVENSLYLIPFEREHGIVGKKFVLFCCHHVRILGLPGKWQRSGLVVRVRWFQLFFSNIFFGKNVCASLTEKSMMNDGLLYIGMECFLSSAGSSILPWKEKAKISRQNVSNTKKEKCANLFYLFSRLFVLVSHENSGFENMIIVKY